MAGAGQLEAGLLQPLAEEAHIVAEPRAQIVARGGQFDRLGGAGDHRRGDRVGEEIGARALAEQFDDRLAAGGEATGRAAKRLAEGRGDDVDPLDAIAMLGGAAAMGADDAGRMAVVDMDEGAIAFGEIANPVERGDDRRPSRRRRRSRSS